MSPALAPIAVYHREPDPGPHHCRERYREVCAECSQEFVLCRVSELEVRMIGASVWTCGDCARRWRRW